MDIRLPKLEEALHRFQESPNDTYRDQLIVLLTEVLMQMIAEKNPSRL